MCGEKLNVEDILFVTRAVSVAYGYAALACTCAGGFTLYYAAPVITFPFATGSGIWTGVFTFVIFILGIKIVKGYEPNYPETSKGKVIALCWLISMDYLFGILHVIFSAVGFSYCSNGLRIGGNYCNEEERPRLLLMESFNIAFGLVIALVSLSMTMYLSSRKRINILAGVPAEEEVKVTCCGGLCTCMIRSGKTYYD
ncbi:uncharacterized protein LOC132743625 isoform X2 [Ruditapes philippinarum]|uniref:uncharacterized protein LOC132743625 isoform X2 n=1 Tax=Ruditapes philippinarum TaxID=129788 RepID=UPI00295C1BBC|nr:uncharacterized protein LOC132743625 isoform X2 [Ruditapes philippinarum]